jgi:hypothetical protein
LVQAAGRAKRLGQKHAFVEIRTMVMKNGFDHFLYTKKNQGNVKITKNNVGEMEWFVTSHLEDTVMNITKKLIHRILERDPKISELYFPNRENVIILRLIKSIVDDCNVQTDHRLFVEFKNGNFKYANGLSYMSYSNEDFALIPDVIRTRNFLLNFYER